LLLPSDAASLALISANDAILSCLSKCYKMFSKLPVMLIKKRVTQVVYTLLLLASMIFMTHLFK